MRQLSCFLALVFVLCWMPRAYAGIVNAPAENIEVSLLTYGPGAIYWERFGHDAVELRDTVSGEAVAFNYGVFDFDEDGFIVNFARGHMRYRMDAEPTESDVSAYSGEGRAVTRQHLNLSIEQRGKLRAFLLWNIQPANVQYNYDYYADNCSTRVRDAINRALDGALEQQLRKRPGTLTYRQQTARLMSNTPALMLGMDLGLGPYADQPLDAWQESFLPMVLQQEVRAVRVSDGQGGTQPLVSAEDVLAKNQLDPPPELPPDLRWPLLLVGLAIGTVIAGLAYGRKHAAARWGFTLFGSLYVLFAGLAGITMTLLWVATAHRSAWANANLLLFNPLALALLPAIWRAHRIDFQPTRFALALTSALAAGPFVALLLHIIPAFIQANMPWILLALPCWLALLYGLFRKRP